jgi:ABC-2 type transport system permease protein
MSLAPQSWPAPVDHARRQPGFVAGTLAVWRWETVKLLGQFRVRAAVGLCLVVPFVVVAALSVQSSVPQDTLFGQWMQETGLATSLAILTFAGQWVLPVLTALVAGDTFSSEDHFATWKSVLTRSRTRGELFAGKYLAALSYTAVVLALLAVATVAAAALSGLKPVVGLTGQTVPTGHAMWLVVASWTTQAAPMLGFCALSVLLSVATRNSLTGVGVTVVVALAMQVVALVDLPGPLRSAVLGTAFGAWHGLWAEQPFYGPLVAGLLCSLAWFVACSVAAWVVFEQRSFRVA